MKILVADDHALFRAGLRHMLLQLGDDVDIVEAGDHEQVVSLVAAHSDLALVLLDLYMPGNQGLAALDTLSRQYPALPIVVLSASQNRTDMQRAFAHGALGFIEKSATVPIMLGALRLVLAGGTYVPPALVHSEPSIETMRSDAISGLTPRQSAVLAGVIEGKSNKLIATELGLAEATVKAHITAVFKTLKVTNRMQAAIAARQFGGAAGPG